MHIQRISAFAFILPSTNMQTLYVLINDKSKACSKNTLHSHYQNKHTAYVCERESGIYVVPVWGLQGNTFPLIWLLTGTWACSASRLHTHTYTHWDYVDKWLLCARVWSKWSNDVAQWPVPYISVCVCVCVFVCSYSSCELTSKCQSFYFIRQNCPGLKLNSPNDKI